MKIILRMAVLGLILLSTKLFGQTNQPGWTVTSCGASGEEGLFWRAYDRFALRFADLITKYQLIRKEFKALRLSMY
jgi:hypothetical protein